MNSLFDMLTKAGYEAGSIGNGILPCTLRIGEEPIGFLMGDLSLRLLPDREKERGRLEPIVGFSRENQGIEQEQGEYVLSRYRNVLFTTAFDYDSCRPVYNIYTKDANGGLTLLDSDGERSAAGRKFASRSGLVSGELPEPVRQAGRVARFMEEARAKNYAFRESREEANRAYDILDSDGREVGYIGKDSRVTIHSEDGRVRKELTGAYLDSGSDAAYLPGFFEKLMERLKEIGMALKVAFTPKGRRYAIHNAEQRKVASVEESTHKVTYTDAATAEEKAKIDALVEEIRREEAQKAQAAKEQPEPEQEAPVPAAPAVSPEEIQRLAGAVLSDRAAAETFLDAVLASPQFSAILTQKLAEMQKAPAQKEAPAVKAQPAQGKDAPEKEKLKQEFNREYGRLQTLFGFNQEKYEALRAEMISKFGSDNPKEFEALLDAVRPDGSAGLQDRIAASEKTAAVQNTARNAEKAQERERA